MPIFLRRFSSIFIAFLLCSTALAGDPTRQVWLISTRDASHCSAADNASVLRYWRLHDDCDWAAADAQEFFGDAAAVPTVVFIHGNRTDANDAVSNGMSAYRSICSQTGDRPFRFVIWSWPSDRACRRNRPDVQLKAAYSDVESGHLAAWLNELRPDAKVSLIGHSFGPRVITGALHLLAGGELAEQKLPDETVRAWIERKRNPIRAVLLATADDYDALAPCGRNGLALSLLDQVLVTRNGSDRVLRFYDRLYGRGGPEAMGFVGPYGVEQSEKLTVVDVSGTVGRTHDSDCYCSASNVCSQWPRYVFFDDAAKP